MMYAGLRIGEACAITSKDIAGDKLTVAQQVVELMKTGHPTIVRLGTGEDGRGDCRRSLVVIQHVTTPDRTEKPSVVRESLRRAGRRVDIRW